MYCPPTVTSSSCVTVSLFEPIALARVVPSSVIFAACESMRESASAPRVQLAAKPMTSSTLTIMRAVRVVLLPVVVSIYVHPFNSGIHLGRRERHIVPGIFNFILS